MSFYFRYQLKRSRPGFQRLVPPLFDRQCTLPTSLQVPDRSAIESPNNAQTRVVTLHPCGPVDRPDQTDVPSSLSHPLPYRVPQRQPL